MAELERNHDVAIVWLPFELRPEPEPLPDMTGPDLARFRTNWEQGVAPLAQRFGMEMRFPSTKPRSRLAHEAAEFARDRDAFDPMRRALFEAFFLQDRDLGDVDVLVDVALSVGLAGEELRAALDEGRFTARVRELERISGQLGVRAVPTMIFGDTIGVEGAQPYEVLRQAYEAAERQAAGTATEESSPD